MTVRHYYEPDGTLHYAVHGVSESEVEESLESPLEILSGERNSKRAIGQTLAGRYLFVVFVPDEVSDSVFVVTAYELVGNARTAFNRRMKRKQKKS